MTREAKHHWKLGYNQDNNNQSEAMERFMSESRRRVVVDAIMNTKPSESLRLGEQLSRSHLRLGTKCLSAPPGAMSEARDRYVPMKLAPADLGDRAAALKKTSVDNAYGHPKNCALWKAVDKEELSRHAAEKFACQPPSGFQELAKDLRKSNVMLSELPSKHRPWDLNPRSEQKSNYVPGPSTVQAGFAATLGKDLRASHYDVAGGKERNCSEWVPTLKASQQDHQDEKWNCRKPKGFEELGVELRKSSVPLAGSGQTYMLRGPTAPPRARQPQY
eukprot:TRINITY_DN56806_c0_g1_i1.p1 TRINITY_DN56806_c0_g1~~TRINITY_DN56806_c0_g1_i1.p1  ORF type:complete len:275 (-),score=42.03 TRINITY_DN56806_c0_g1_i1:169-993(-)